jgi:hypothetical protein
MQLGIKFCKDRITVLANSDKSIVVDFSIARVKNMKRLAALLTALPLFGAITLSASKALADSYATGSLTYYGTFTQSSDYYPAYHGWLYLGGQYYFWGGSWCSSYPYKPAPIDQHALFDALNYRKTVGIYYKPGAYSYRCVTGIVIYNTTATASTDAQAESAPPPLPTPPQ